MKISKAIAILVTIIIILLLIILASVHINFLQSKNSQNISNDQNEDVEYVGVEDLILELKTDKDKYNINETIKIELNWLNPTNKTVKVQLMTSQKFWGIIQISNESFAEVIYNSSNYLYLPVITEISIDPFGSTTILDIEFKKNTKTWLI